MIIPTADFDPLFAPDGPPFAERMQAYIRSEFAELLEHGSDETALSATPPAAHLADADRIRDAA